MKLSLLPGVTSAVILGFRGFKLLTIALLIAAAGARTLASPIISEMMASNKTGITDQDGDNADWLEIYNPDSTTDNLSGWYLTDSSSNLTLWQFPAVTIPAHGYLLVFCSEKNYTSPSAPLATNFNLSASGGYVALVEANGSTIASSVAFPVQYADISYGVSQPTNATEAAQYGYFAVATPGAANGNYTNILLPVTPVLSASAGLFTGTKTVAVSGATGTEHIRYVLVPSSSTGLVAAGPTASSPLYTGPISVGSTEYLIAKVFSSDDSQQSFPAAALYVQMDNATSNRVDTFASSIPLVVFDDHGYGLLVDDDLYHPGYFGAFSVGSSGSSTLTQTPDFFTADGMKLHGFSSANFPKQSYDFDLEDDLGDSAPQATFGMDSNKDWAAVSAWYYDRTFIHNLFVYSLGRALGYWEPATTPVEMFIHSSGGILDATSYSGITTVTDRLKVGSSRINIASITPLDVTAPSVTGGYILRIDHPETDLYTFTTAQGVTAMVDTPQLDVIVPAQEAYIANYVQQMENAMVSDAASGYATHAYLNYLDRPSWVDYHLINVFVENDDAFQYSEYFTKDTNGLIKAGPLWDYDRSLGSADGRDLNPYQWTVYSISPDFWNIGWWRYVTHDPDFMQAWIDRWQSLRLTTLSTANLIALTNAAAARVGPAPAARDAARWPDDVSRYPGGWQGEIDAMEAYLGARAEWIDNQFVAPPGVSISPNGGITLIPPQGASVAYTLNGSDPRASGGTATSVTTLVAGPVTLPAGQTFSARSYNAAMTAFPGSPWSSPVTAANATTLEAGAFINVSCMTQVGNTTPLIEGFSIAGTAGTSQQFVIRGVGPGLSGFGVNGVLAQPVLTVYGSGSTLIAADTGWGNDTNASALISASATVGAFALATGSADSALLVSLAPGAYTLQVTGANGTAGAALAETYQLLTTNGSPLVNVSCSAGVGGSYGSLTAAFVIQGGPAEVLVRADGPALSAYGVPSVLAQPVLQVYDGGGRLLATNAGWGSGANASQIAAAAIAVGAFPLASGSADSAVLLTLPPGSYSAVVSGVGGGSGTALAECYVVPTS